MSHRLSRRRLLKTGLGAGLAGSLGLAYPYFSQASDSADPRTFPSPYLEPYVDELPVPPVVRGDRTLAVAGARHRFHRDLNPAPTWGYGGQAYLGPTVDAHAHESLELTFENQLGMHLFAKDIDTSLHGATEAARTMPPVSVHLHGAVAPPDMDGHPEDVFVPGGSRRYRYDNPQEAAHLWYHDHAEGLTRLNVFGGLAGMYLLRDGFDTGGVDNAWGLPSGEFEMPLVLQDRRFHEDGSLNFRTLTSIPEGKWDPGQIGDLMTVNGVVSPYYRVAKGLYRFRVVNGSNYRSYHLFFSNRMAFWVVGNDGGVLDTSVLTTSVRLTPGERIDLVVDFSRLSMGERVELTNDQEEVPIIKLVSGAEPLPHLVQFIGTGVTGHTATPPARLRGGAGRPPLLPRPETPVRTRVVALTQDGDLKRWPPVGMSLNNLSFTDEDIEMPRQGTTELWEIVNATVEEHPVHLHLVNMRILNRQEFRLGAYLLANPRPPKGTRWAPSPARFLKGEPEPPAAWEAGAKDTVACPEGMVTRVLVRFPSADELGFDPDATWEAAGGGHSMEGMEADQQSHTLQGYVWHCHILDHEDDCMMARYRLVES
ncbi:multicopper oxidase family protein [Streptomyces sp. NPDC096132]|uniref:multicopper oxidase family protein n=1 Tax=Streptomyces sp. NPDC096132 TaxID=3366075 RepID=UPI0037FE2432